MVTLDAPTLPHPEFTALKSSSAFDKVQRGAHLYQKGDTAGALDEYNAALEMAPDDADLRRTRALLLGDLRRYEEAIAEFDHLLSSQQGTSTYSCLREWRYTKSPGSTSL